MVLLFRSFLGMLCAPCGIGLITFRLQTSFKWHLWLFQYVVMTGISSFSPHNSQNCCMTKQIMRRCDWWRTFKFCQVSHMNSFRLVLTTWQGINWANGQSNQYQYQRISLLLLKLRWNIDVFPRPCYYTYNPLPPKFCHFCYSIIHYGFGAKVINTPQTASLPLVKIIDQQRQRLYNIEDLSHTTLMARR